MQLSVSEQTGLAAAFKKIFGVIPTEQRPKAMMVLSVMVLSSLIQVVGVVSVLPFLVVLANPDLIMENTYLNAVYRFLRFDTAQQFLIALGIATFAILLVSTGLRSLAFYAQQSFSQQQRLTLGTRIMAGYLTQPYRFFVQTADAELAKTLTQDTAQFIDRGLIPAATVVNSALQLLTLVAMLLFLDPVVTLIMAATLGITYMVLYRVAQAHLLRHGQARHDAELKRNHTVWEILAGIKVIKLGGQEQTFLQRFEELSIIVSRSLSSVAFMQTLPRYLIEAIAFGCIVLLALVLTLNATANNNASDSNVLPVLAIYAFAGYRMMPALQQLYSGLASVRNVTPTIDKIATQIAELELTKSEWPQAASMPILRQIEIEEVSYNHVSNARCGIEDITIGLPAGSSLGLVGSSGAGKTTLIDVFLGLLIPSAGRLVVDGVPIDIENRRSWQKCLGYVPQDIFLATRSVAENIAFGIDVDDIDLSKVQDCARIAQIHDVIMSELPNGYDTQIGDRGMRLSGGQRQRIGIARALYWDPAVLVFDEATNALDTVTEARVLDAIKLHCTGKTLIVIAHRLSTVASCDQIAVLDQGRLMDLGSFSELRTRSSIFGDLVRADENTRLTD